MTPILARAAALALLAAAASAQTDGPPRLQTTPAVPAPGAEVAVTYAPTDALAGADVVTLRARLRTPDDMAYDWGAETRALATLRRGADGAFRGRFVLPNSVVYAVLTVTSASGDIVDANLRLGWPLRVGAGGRPSADALGQETQDRTGVDSRGALRAARESVRLHPDDPWSWYVLSFHEQAAEGSAAADSAATDRLARFDRALAAAPDADRAAGLVWYADGVDDTVASRWRDWPRASAPTHRETVPLRVFDVQVATVDDPAARLEALDALWAEVGATHRNLLRAGLDAAVEAGDRAQIGTWADRTDRAYPWQRDGTALTLAASGGARAEGLRRLRAEIGRPLDPDARGLLVTVAEHREWARARSARLSGALGLALADAGDWGAALAPLAAATEASWDARLLRAASQARLAAGDTAGAARDLARLAADPALAADDTTGATGARLVGADAWASLVAQDRTDLRRRTLSESVTETLSPVALVDTAGAPVAFRETLAATGPTVVVLFSEDCQYCRLATPGIEALSVRAAPLGVRVEVFMSDPPVPASREGLAQDGYTGPVYHDPGAKLAAALGTAETPTYVVFDAGGVLRFRYSSLAEVPRQLWALGVEGL